MDLFGLPPNVGADIQVFNSPATVSGTQWKTWNKPRGKSMALMIVIGGGGGGGGGHSAAAGQARAGGGGGGSSAVTRLIIPTVLLPERLFVQVGMGSVGAAPLAGSAGTAMLSYVAVAPNSTANNVIAASGAAPASGGGGGTGTTAGAPGGGGSAAGLAQMYLSSLGHVFSLLGQAGIIGGAAAGAIGPPQSLPLSTAPTMGGSGGAGTTNADFAGGIITAVADTLLSEIKPQGAVAGSVNGSGGFLITAPFFSYPGLGGASSNAGIGGAGGPGGPGSGGGGGGGGTTGGRGGDGGNGLVYIISW